LLLGNGQPAEESKMRRTRRRSRRGQVDTNTLIGKKTKANELDALIFLKKSTFAKDCEPLTAIPLSIVLMDLEVWEHTKISATNTKSNLLDAYHGWFNLRG
jgi:hypothetical protein